ncbi:hypothetical protein D3C87_2137280 [compost metagenome]
MPAFRLIVANRRSRHNAMPLAMPAVGMMVSRLRKNEVSIMSNARPDSRSLALSACETSGWFIKPKRSVIR